LALAGVAGSFSFREPSRFLLLVTPFIAVVVANVITLWPLGPIRVNMFLLGYLMVLVFTGGSQLTIWVTRLASARMGLACHGGVVAMFLFYCGIAFVRVMPFAPRLGPPHEDFPHALRSLLGKIPEGSGRRPLVLVNFAATRAFTYYTTHHPELSRTLGASLKDRAEVLIGDEAYSGAEKFSEVMARRNPDQPVWFLYSHYDIPAQKEVFARFGEIRNEHDVPGAGVFELVLRR
jgi:hypothetical protein